jgi:hypothetical protein
VTDEDRQPPRRRRPAADPQAALRLLVIRLLGGCEVCGHTPCYAEAAQEMHVSHSTLRPFLVAQQRLPMKSADKVAWWVWKRLNPEAQPEGAGTTDGDEEKGRTTWPTTERTADRE